MSRYRYRALDGTGGERRGRLRARDRAEAEAVLRSRGWIPRELSAVEGRRGRTRAARVPGREGGEVGRRVRRWPGPARIRPREVTLFTRQLATLLRSGVPLLRSLEVLQAQEGNRALARVIGHLADTVRAGHPLSAGLAEHPRVFDSPFVPMVRAGEAGGVLEGGLARLATYRENSERLRGRLRSATAYPAVVVAVALAVVVLLLVQVVPQFERIFADLLGGAELPALTRGVVGIGRLLRDHFPLLVGAVLPGTVLAGWFLRSGPGRRWAEGLLLRLPRIRGLVTKATVARCARSLGTLLANGVPILEALTITRGVVGPHRFAEALRRIHDRVRDGETLAAPMAGERLFPPMVTSMVEVGEETGQLEEMLGRVADAYEEEVDREVNTVTSLLEPVLIVFLAVVVGGVVLALFLPIVRIIETLGG